MSKVIITKGNKFEFKVQVARGGGSPIKKNVGNFRWSGDVFGWLITPANPTIGQQYQEVMDTYLDKHPDKNGVFTTPSTMHIKYVLNQALKNITV